MFRGTWNILKKTTTITAKGVAAATVLAINPKQGMANIKQWATNLGIDINAYLIGDTHRLYNDNYPDLLFQLNCPVCFFSFAPFLLNQY